LKLAALSEEVEEEEEIIYDMWMICIII